jgi:hypothetical protein
MCGNWILLGAVVGRPGYPTIAFWKIPLSQRGWYSLTLGVVASPDQLAKDIISTDLLYDILKTSSFITQ